MPVTRPIPEDIYPAVEQAMLNMFLGSTTNQIAECREAAIAEGDRINKAYDKWLNERRNATAIQHRDYNGERRRATNGN